MCTLVLAWQVFDGTPIAAAANRDEALSRPSRPPGVLGSGAAGDSSEACSDGVADTDPTVVAPQDAEAGGTWIGYNDAGLFVAVTNRRADVDGERSRGLLVRDALGQSSASEAGSLVRDELAAREYAGFNLVMADAESAGLLEWDGILRTTHFDPGIHVVVNEGYDGAAEKATRVRDAIRPDLDADASAWFERAKGVLRDHELEVCVHREGYGTRSSSLVRIDDDRTGRYWFADGKPCETDYELVETGGETAADGTPADGTSTDETPTDDRAVGTDAGDGQV